MLFARLSDRSVLLLLLFTTFLMSRSVVGADLDDLDRAEFNEAIAHARECITSQDTACVEEQLALAQRRAGSSGDKTLIEQLRSAGMRGSIDNGEQAANERAVIRAQKQRRQAVRQARINDDAAQAANQPSAADVIRRAGAQMNQQLASQLAEKQYARERLAETQRQQAQAQRRAQAAERLEPVRKPVAYDQAKPQVVQPVAATVSPPAPPPAAKSVKPVKTAEVSIQPEALAFCWQSKRGGWWCDGPGDETTIAEKDQAGQISGVGCKKPSLLVPSTITLTSTRVPKRGSVSGWLYRCGKQLKPGDTGHATWNRDIRRFWSGIPG